MAYWLSRLGELLVRLLQQVVRIPRVLLLRIDDSIVLVLSSLAPLVAATSLTSLMLLCGLGVPLSWEKLKLSWIGWTFRLDSFKAVLLDDKPEKRACMLKPLLRSGVKMLRMDSEHLLGRLLWFTCGAVWLRPWLQSFYSLLHKPLTTCRLVNLEQVREVFGGSVPCCDIVDGWKLYTVNNTVVFFF